MKKRNFFTIWVLCALFWGVACNTQTAKTEYRGRIITLTDSTLRTGKVDTLNFGRLYSGEECVLNFWLENKSSQPLLIQSYDRTCGCTELDFKREPIKPNTAQRLSVSLDSRGLYGWQLKVIDLRFATQNQKLRLLIHADIY